MKNFIKERLVFNYGKRVKLTTLYIEYKKSCFDKVMSLASFERLLKRELPHIVFIRSNDALSVRGVAIKVEKKSFVKRLLRL